MPNCKSWKFIKVGGRSWLTRLNMPTQVMLIYCFMTSMTREQLHVVLYIFFEACLITWGSIEKLLYPGNITMESKRCNYNHTQPVREIVQEYHNPKKIDYSKPNTT